MKNIFETLEQLSIDLMYKSTKAPTKAATLAYADASKLLEDEIIKINNQIKMEADYKIEKQMQKFDIYQKSVDGFAYLKV